MSVVRSHQLSIGIVGLPNSGKSTIFNALTRSAVPAENYPFCTIDKNVGVIKIKDERLDRLAHFYQPERIVPSAMTFVDIAGLVKGASKGEGLGNMFLAHIREADAILYVLRAFRSETITHVYERIDPADDLKIVRSELILRDIDTVEKRLDELGSKMKSGGTPELRMQKECLEKVLKGLNDEIPAGIIDLTVEQRLILREMWLLTDKPALYLLNIKGGVDEELLKEWRTSLLSVIPSEEADFILPVDCKMEIDVVDLNNDERQELTGMVSNYHSAEDIVLMAFKRLDLLTFYTGNEKEVNAWTIRRGATVKEAAGVIHSDLEDNFVAAEIVPVDEVVSKGGWNKVKELGLIKNVSKDYLVSDGDYISVLAHKS